MISPVKASAALWISASVIWSVGYVWSISVSKSILGVLAPKTIVPVYYFCCDCMPSICFVIFPVHKIKSTVAKGSNVPAWPIFLALMPYFTFLTAWKEVQPKGLSTRITRAGSGLGWFGLVSDKMGAIIQWLRCGCVVNFLLKIAAIGTNQGRHCGC